MKMKLLLASILVAGALSAGPRVSVGLNFGPGHFGPGYYPALPPPRAAFVPRCPGPGYVWTGGYWHPGANQYYWQPGAWVRPPQARARWVAPRVHRGHFYRGYWR
jgi:hypothetical protein